MLDNETKKHQFKIFDKFFEKLPRLIGVFFTFKGLLLVSKKDSCRFN